MELSFETRELESNGYHYSTRRQDIDLIREPYVVYNSKRDELYCIGECIYVKNIELCKKGTIKLYGTNDGIPSEMICIVSPCGNYLLFVTFRDVWLYDLVNSKTITKKTYPIVLSGAVSDKGFWIVYGEDANYIRKYEHYNRLNHSFYLTNVPYDFYIQISYVQYYNLNGDDIYTKWLGKWKFCVIVPELNIMLNGSQYIKIWDMDTRKIKCTIQTDSISDEYFNYRILDVKNKIVLVHTLCETIAYNLTTGDKLWENDGNSMNFIPQKDAYVIIPLSNRVQMYDILTNKLLWEYDSLIDRVLYQCSFKLCEYHNGKYYNIWSTNKAEYHIKTLTFNDPLIRWKKENHRYQHQYTKDIIRTLFVLRETECILATMPRELLMMICEEILF